MFLKVLLFVVCAVWAQQALSAEIPNDWAVDIVSKENIHIKFPFFTENLKNMDPRLREMINENLHETLQYTYENIVNQPGYAGWVRVAAGYTTMGYRHQSRRKALGIGLGLNGKFNEAMKDMFFRLLAKSNEEKKRLKAMKVPQNRQALILKTSKIINTLEEAIAASPVATYVDWSKGVVDGQNFEQFASKLMGELKYHGIGGALDYIGGLMKILSMITRSGGASSQSKSS